MPSGHTENVEQQQRRDLSHSSSFIHWFNLQFERLSRCPCLFPESKSTPAAKFPFFLSNFEIDNSLSPYLNLSFTFSLPISLSHFCNIYLSHMFALSLCLFLSFSLLSLFPHSPTHYLIISFILSFLCTRPSVSLFLIHSSFYQPIDSLCFRSGPTKNTKLKKSTPFSHFKHASKNLFIFDKLS